MYRSKKDVDKHVESLISKLSVKEFKSRAYSVARLYFEVGDYASCQRYVEQYLTQKDNNAAAHKLLGQALQKLGQKEKALEQYRTSHDIDPTQTSLILDICELLADDEVIIDPGRAKYWCEKAEATFPRHPTTFRLRERLVTMVNPDPEALVTMLMSELAVRPKDASLHIRLLKHYLQTNKIKEAFEHSCNVEFGGNTFLSNYAWYETLTDILKHNSQNSNNWLYQLLLLTVRERLCVLSLTEIPSGTNKSLIESNELLHIYDQAIESVARAGVPPGFGDFHSSLLHHHRGQFALHAATLLLKRAKRDQIRWRDAIRAAAPLMLIAWHTVPLDIKVNWLTHAPVKQQNAVHRWYSEGSYRCSQSGHYLISNIQDKSHSFLDRISQCCSDIHWRDKLYEQIFTSRDHLSRINSSHFVSNAFSSPTLRLPKKIEVETYDRDAQREHPNSLHHFVWILLNYKNYAHFKCTLFDMLTSKSPNFANCGPETLNKLDIYAFLYSAALTTFQQRSNRVTYGATDKPNVIPANITDLLCPLSQIKWWDCAYKFSQNELGTELTNIRATLSRGIEVVRCIDNHGLDPELLCILGRIFSEQAKNITAVDEKNSLEIRACLYYSSAIPLLEKIKSKIIIKFPEKRLFDYTHKEFSSKDLNSLIEESKLYVAVSHLNDCEYEKVIELLSNVKSPQAYYHLSETFKKMALEEYNSSQDVTSIETKSKYATLLSKAKNFAYKALDKLKTTEINHPLYSQTQELIEDIEIRINKIDSDISGIIINDVDAKYSSDDNGSGESDRVLLRTNTRAFRNLSSTPKQPSNSNMTNYCTAINSQILENTRVDQQFLERIENQIKNLQKRDITINDFMEQTKNWFEENRNLGNQIISTIQSNIQSTADQFKLLKISVDRVKDQIDECRNECKDVGDIKKQLADLKKEINKLKKASSEQNIDESDLYNLDDDYRTNDSASTFATQLPFPPQVIPPFNQRMVPQFPVPPNPYQLYGQNLYNLYNQYSQFTQPPPVPAAPPLFDTTRSQVNYPGVYPTPDQMYLDVAHLVPPTVPTAPIVPTAHTMSTVPTVPTVSVPPPASTTTSRAAPTFDTKEIPRSLPVNVVITSSDPLPTCTTAPAPILSVTIPPQHIKGTPHNYQIPMPSTNETKVVPPPVFSFPNNKFTTTSNLFPKWNQSTVFQTTQPTITTVSSANSTLYSPKNDNAKNVVDVVSGSPNTSLNKSRTLSEKSNTSVENYDPCPDFKPIIPLPAEIKVTTGEEDETVIFSARAKLFRFVDKQWKERGLGEIKLLKHKCTGKVRVLMRREQVHKVCANHIITPEIEIKPMKNESKAYFWVANDFADETVVLEKFCIRFKTVDIAQKFYETFENARRDCLVASTNNTITENNFILNTSKALLDNIKTSEVNTEQTVTSQGVKTVIGGFTFLSSPTFKSVPDDKNLDVKPSESATSKVNVFSGLTFKTNTTSPFKNLFNTTTEQQNQVSPVKLNNSDTVEEFEPTVEFKPVVPLPALVDQKTGEEDETILFEHRAKLLRFEASSKEWKERGLGNIKLLLHKDNIQKLRLLMRREQVMKVCCNHAITKEMVFQKMPNMEKAVTWCAKDYSEGYLVPETFCLRFKTVQACDNFIEAVKLAQSKMKDESKAAKEEQNAAKQNNQVGFGDKFKPKPGSWYCESCYTNNLESFEKCACCEQPKPHTAISQTVSYTPDVSSNWGEKFKPKAGTWECKECLVRNEATVEYCSACNNPKNPTTTKADIKLVPDNSPKFNFGIPAQSSNSTDDKKVTPAFNELKITTSGWGDKFKPKMGTWECKECFVRNESNINNCSACNSPKDPIAVKNESKSIFNIPSGPKFNFGIPSTTSADQKTTDGATSIFDGTGAHKFSFGIPSNIKDKTTIVISFGDQKPSASTILPTPKETTENDGPVNFSLKKNDEQNTPAMSIKPALLSTPQKSSTTFGSKESGTFDFVFKPKTPPKSKSSVKSPKSEKGEESDGDGNEYASEDEGHHIHFSPVIPMPDKVEVVTGEENEDELYGHRAKLYRFISGEWKERGIGIVKILEHRDTKKLRVVMRREQVLKICLNHALTPEITYTPKDEKTWLFAANDFSEGELNLQRFCLRFESKEVALNFKCAVDKAREQKSVTKLVEDAESDKNKNDGDDVIFVSEIQATREEKQKAKELMLPENFFTYNNKEPCQGCRGCKDDDDVKPSSTTNIITTTTKVSPVTTTVFSTPAKISTSPFQSPANSFYGTPTNFNKTVDTSVFRTPLESIGSNVKSTPTGTSDNIIVESDSTNKENAFINKPKFLPVLSEQKSIFGTPQTKLGNLLGAGDTQTPTNTKNSQLATQEVQKFNMNTFESEKQSTGSIFGFTQTTQLSETKPVQPLFGNANLDTTKKSIFGFSADSKQDQNKKPEVRSIFGADSDQKPVNLFSGSTQGSLFGPSALQNQTKPDTGSFGATSISIFGSSTPDQTKVFDSGSGKSIFGKASNETSTWTFSSKIDQIKPDMTKNVSTDKKNEVEADEPTKEGPFFKVDTDLTFAALSSSGTESNFQKKADFQWEGAGQQLFTKPNKASSKEKGESAGDEGEAGAEEEYDPHYEPIVPLPEKIVVTTGEEDEEKLFGERCKLYRYDENSREWKERGVGEIKLLYHPTRNTYRLLLRREQVYKAVLNMLLFMDLELLPMKQSARAWTWAGRNYAESAAGEQETLAVRFKSVELATAFQSKVVECVRKLQAAAAQAIREEKETPFESVAPLRLPKHLEEGARADTAMLAKVEQQSTSAPAGDSTRTDTQPKPDGEVINVGTTGPTSDGHSQQHEEEGVEEEQEDEEDYESYYDHNEDYDAYYNENEEAAFQYTCDAVVCQGGARTQCEHAFVQMLYDQELEAHRVTVAEPATGELLADMLIHSDTEFLIDGESCTWSGMEYAGAEPVSKTVTLNFGDSDSAMQFYDNCETIKATSYSSTDPDP